ncbi:MAG: tyrosine-type recombinase/integrase [Streptosporangiaceae bacterium]
MAIGERTGGPVFLAADGRRLDRRGAGRIVRKAARHAGIPKAVTPHTLRHAFITAALDTGGPLARRPRRCLACGPENHHAVRPGPRQPGPARRLYWGRLYRGRRQIVRTGWQLRLAAMAARRSWRTVRCRQPKPAAAAVLTATWRRTRTAVLAPVPPAGMTVGARSRMASLSRQCLQMIPADGARVIPADGARAPRGVADHRWPCAGIKERMAGFRHDRMPEPGRGDRGRVRAPAACSMLGACTGTAGPGQDSR